MPLRAISHTSTPTPDTLTNLVYPIAELFHRRVGVVKDDRLVVVRDLPLRLGVDADHVAIIPDLL